MGGVCLSVENPSVGGYSDSYIGSTVGDGSIPPSTYENGLVPSINPIDTSGNLVVTGNIGGGRHFRGIVPYSGATDFEAASGSLRHTSAYLDSFLRRSAGVEDYGAYTGSAVPFYSPSQTVTAMRPGSGEIVAAPRAGVGISGYEVFSGLDLPDEQVLYYQDSVVSELSSRPMSLTQGELERTIADDVWKYPQGGLEQEAEGGDEGEGMWRDYVSPEMTEKRGEMLVDVLNQPLVPEGEGGLELRRTRGLEGRSDEEAEQGTEGMLTPFANSLEGVWGLDVYDLMKKELGQLPASLEGLEAEQLAVDSVGQLPGAVTGLEVAGEGIGLDAESSRGQQEPAPWGQAGAGLAVTGLGSDEQQGTAEKRLGGVELPVAGAGGFAEGYESFAVFKKDRFNRHIAAAERYMKEGRYYRAADAYTLATVYKPKDPLGYAGKSFALFAAGEYMSSSLFLSRAIEIFPEYAKFKVDLVEMIGDRDKIESRLVEARQWAKQSGAAELDFLLSYVYYQLGRLEFARQSVGSAYKRMPDSPAVATLKKAIEEHIASL